MSHSSLQFDVIPGNAVTPAQEKFINHWSQVYFGAVAVSKDLAAAPVHWRLILREGDNLLSQVALTEFHIDMDEARQIVGAVGGLFTPSHLQKNGYGNALMDLAEEFIFTRLRLPMGILFCLPELVPFYSKRRWSLIEMPVTLQQKGGVMTWGAAVMILSSDGIQSGSHLIHVPNQPTRENVKDSGRNNDKIPRDLGHV